MLRHSASLEQCKGSRKGSRAASRHVPWLCPQLCSLPACFLGTSGQSCGTVDILCRAAWGLMQARFVHCCSLPRPCLHGVGRACAGYVLWAVHSLVWQCRAICSSKSNCESGVLLADALL